MSADRSLLTAEPELTSAVDLCAPDGRRLNPQARGWSRTPLHRANLRGVWGRTKRWDYWAVLAGDLLVSVTYADVDYIGIAAVWWCDLASDASDASGAGATGGRDVIVPFARGLDLPDVPATRPLRYSGKSLTLELVDDPDGTTRIAARWRERDGREGSLAAAIALPPGHESLNVVIPWTDRRFQFTSKHQARPAVGTLRVGETEYAFGTAAGTGGEPAWGVLDVGRGRWPYRTRWNWAGGAGSSVDGRTVGLQLGGKWTDGTGFTENGMIVDGRLHKLGVDLAWDYSWDEPLRPWRVVAAGGELDLTLTPRYDKHSRTAAVVLATEVHQVFGTWSGRFRTDDGGEVVLDGLQGFAEESRSRW